MAVSRLADAELPQTFDVAMVKPCPGRYDIGLKWAVDEGASPSPAGANRASIVTAVQELELKLESTKGPAEILVIDRVERPSAN